MALDIKRLWARVKEPVLYTTVGAVLVLSIKQCGDENNTQSMVQSVAETTGSVYNVVNTVKTVAAATQKVANGIDTTVKRTEKKVDNFQETADTMFARMDSCYDCNKNKKPVVRPRRPVPAVKPKPKEDVQYEVIVECVTRHNPVTR